MPTRRGRTRGQLPGNDSVLHRTAHDRARTRSAPVGGGTRRAHPVCVWVWGALALDAADELLPELPSGGGRAETGGVTVGDLRTREVKRGQIFTLKLSEEEAAGLRRLAEENFRSPGGQLRALLAAETAKLTPLVEEDPDEGDEGTSGGFRVNSGRGFRVNSGGSYDTVSRPIADPVEAQAVLVDWKRNFPDAFLEYRDAYDRWGPIVERS